MTDRKTEALKLALEALEKHAELGLLAGATITAIREALAEQPAQQKPACKQNLQVWVISNGKGRGQFSWEPQDERYWTRMEPAIKQDLTPEQPAQQQEPVAWITQGGKGWLRFHNKNDDHLNKTSVPLYKYPKRKPLSDAEIALISAECSLRTPSDIYFARAIEAAHGIKE